MCSCPLAVKSKSGRDSRSQHDATPCPALALFFLPPLIAEFFLGDFPVTLLPLIVALAPCTAAVHC
jgi:hypothetical protein